MEAAYSPVLGSGPSEEKFEAMLQELLYTEKSYVKRVETLYRVRLCVFQLAPSFWMTVLMQVLRDTPCPCGN